MQHGRSIGAQRAEPLEGELCVAPHLGDAVAAEERAQVRQVALHRAAVGEPAVAGARSAAAAQRSAWPGRPSSAKINAPWTATAGYRSIRRCSSNHSIQPQDRVDPAARPDGLRQRPGPAARPGRRHRRPGRGRWPSRAGRWPAHHAAAPGGARGTIAGSRRASSASQQITEQVVISVPLAAGDRAGRRGGSAPRASRGSRPSPSFRARRRTAARHPVEHRGPGEERSPRSAERRGRAARTAGSRP